MAKYFHLSGYNMYSIHHSCVKQNKQVWLKTPLEIFLTILNMFLFSTKSIVSHLQYMKRHYCIHTHREMFVVFPGK